MALFKTKNPGFRLKGRKRRPLHGGSELGDLLSTLRIQQGWTREMASLEAGLSPRIIAKLETGGLDTSLSNLEKYLNFYGLTLSVKSLDAAEPAATTRENSDPDLDERGLPKW